MSSKQLRQYTEEFKRETVELIKRSGKSQAQISRELGISSKNLSRWVQAYGQNEGEYNQESPSLAEYKAIQAELRRVTEERDILKKALNIFSRTG